MSKHQQYVRDAYEVSYDFWRSPEMMIAQAVRVNGGDGSRAARKPVVRDARLLPRETQAQLAAARTSVSIRHQTKRALPTGRQVRRAARRGAASLARKLVLRFGIVLVFALMAFAFAGAAGLLGR